MLAETNDIRDLQQIQRAVFRFPANRIHPQPKSDLLSIDVVNASLLLHFHFHVVKRLQSSSEQALNGANPRPDSIVFAFRLIQFSGGRVGS